MLDKLQRRRAQRAIRIEQWFESLVRGIDNGALRVIKDSAGDGSWTSVQGTPIKTLGYKIISAMTRDGLNLYCIYNNFSQTVWVCNGSVHAIVDVEYELDRLEKALSE
ncbi:MAG: hypothetical protein GY942_01365 [Aestuariibacter sp.]|nr:hypothetical protein [Aestuariibacter sp.]